MQRRCKKAASWRRRRRQGLDFRYNSYGELNRGEDEQTSDGFRISKSFDAATNCIQIIFRQIYCGIYTVATNAANDLASLIQRLSSTFQLLKTLDMVLCTISPIPPLNIFFTSSAGCTRKENLKLFGTRVTTRKH